MQSEGASMLEGFANMGNNSQSTQQTSSSSSSSSTTTTTIPPNPTTQQQTSQIPTPQNSTVRVTERHIENAGEEEGEEEKWTEEDEREAAELMAKIDRLNELGIIKVQQKH